MTRPNASRGRPAWPLGLGLAAMVTAAAWAGWYWRGHSQAVTETQPAPAGMAAMAVSYPAPGKEPAVRTEFPTGAAVLSGAEIVAALSDHTAVLPGGFVEYYAPDGTLHGLAEEKHYGGSWEVRNGAFCTLLQGSDESVCSLVERKGGTLYWSLDGEKEASPVSTMPGNPRNLT